MGTSNMSIKSTLRNWLLTDVKASDVAPLLSMHKLGQPVWTDRDYEKLAEEGYKKNVVAYKSINELISSAEQLPWEVVRVDSEGSQVPAPESPLAQLLRRPNPWQGGPAFFGELCGYYQISGNGYIEANKPGRSSPPVELYTHRPDRMKVIAGTQGPAGYEYKVSGVAKTWQVDDDEIRHIKSFNPTDDWYGMSPIEAAAYDIDIHNETLAWNKSLLDNRAQPSGAMMYEPRNPEAPDTLTDDQFERLKAELDAQSGQGGQVGRPLLLEGGLKWVQLSMSPQDMDYINSKNTTARDICMAFGVPPQLLGIPGDNTYSNMAEARLSLWEQTVLPWAYRVRDELNAWLAPMFGDEYRIIINEDKILALSARREALWKKAQESDFLTYNEKRELVGYEEVDGGEQLLVPAMMLPLGSAGEQETESEKSFTDWLVKECGYTQKQAAHTAALAFKEEDTDA